LCQLLKQLHKQQIGSLQCKNAPLRCGKHVTIRTGSLLHAAFTGLK